jgi:NADH:ubiquinone oxidoreductase subunit 5 (subunit L)/multisubunit Na+/H+ antiporter MnhA subunit
LSAWTSITIAVGAPLLVAMFLAVARPRGHFWLIGGSLAAPLVSLWMLLGHFSDAGGGGLVGAPVAWMPEFNLLADYLVDRLSVFFAVLVAGMGAVIVLYARAYFGPDTSSLQKFYPRLLLFMSAMLGLVLADNFMYMLLFWELTSISSFLLIGWEQEEKEAVKKALAALVTTAAGGLALMAGLIVLGLHTGVWSFSELMAVGVEPTAASGAAFVLIFVGAAAKSAQWPLHFWLPGAMAAPTPVSAYLHSATMVKAGVYLLARLQPVFGEVLPLWPQLILVVGAVTMVVGGYYALRQADLKLTFAYTTVSQLGLLCCVSGLGFVRWENQPNVIWDTSQILNHAMYKAPLFMLAGGLYHLLHTRDVHQLRGLVRNDRVTVHARAIGVLLVLGVIAMASGPLTLAFTAKEFFYYQFAHAAKAVPWLYALVPLLVVAAACHVAIALRVCVSMLSRPAADCELGHDAEAPHDSTFWTAMLYVPSAVLIGGQFALGSIPHLADAVLLTFERSPNYFASFPLVWDIHAGLPIVLSGVGIATGLALGVSSLARGERQDPHQRLFPAFYGLVTKGGGWVFGLVQTGNFRTYAAVTFVTIGGVLVSLGVRTGLFSGISLPAERMSWSLMIGVFLAGFAAVSAVLMPLIRDRASRILLLGTVGFAVAGMFYVYRAPDLALTQIAIEIVSLILFLLVLAVLPSSPIRSPRPLPRLLIASSMGLVGAMVTLAVCSAPIPVSSHTTADGQPLAHLGEYFLRNSYTAQDTTAHTGGGGNNVVNVILVDFRGYDTLGEITVVAIAALGVWTLLRRTRDPDEVDVEPASRLSSMTASGAESGVRT